MRLLLPLPFVRSRVRIIGDLKLFKLKTMGPLIAVRDREERGRAWLAMWTEVDVTCRL